MPGEDVSSPYIARKGVSFFAQNFLFFGEKVTEANGMSCYNEANKRKTRNKTEVTLMKYVCDVCGWEYDEELGYPEGGIAPGTKWEDIPEDFECPLCSVGKDMFSEN